MFTKLTRGLLDWSGLQVGIWGDFWVMSLEKKRGQGSILAPSIAVPEPPCRSLAALRTAIHLYLASFHPDCWPQRALGDLEESRESAPLPKA